MGFNIINIFKQNLNSKYFLLLINYIFIIFYCIKKIYITKFKLFINYKSFYLLIYFKFLLSIIQFIFLQQIKLSFTNFLF
jgi:hypothetical protein